MSELVETYRGVVYPWQCDHMGHMNVMWYTGKFDEATWGLFHRVGITPSYMRTRQRGMAAVEQAITYRRELLAGDIVFVRSAILEVRDKALRFRHELVNADTGEIAATSELTAVHLDASIRKACPLPQEVVERVRGIIGGGA